MNTLLVFMAWLIFLAAFMVCLAVDGTKDSAPLVTIRRLHLVRPDLIFYPLAIEVYA